MYIDAPILAEATCQSKLQLYPFGVGFSQASFLKNLIVIGSLFVMPGRVIDRVQSRLLHLRLGRLLGRRRTTPGHTKRQSSAQNQVLQVHS
ncbi:MAG: hypothetical protein ABSF96_08460 [Steroidobacteraceae bacterium]